MNVKLLLVIAALAVFQNSQPSSLVGVVSELDAKSKTITIKTDQDATILIQATDTTVFLRVPAGAQSLQQATTIQMTDIVAGDRVSARGTKGDHELVALRVVVLSKADVARQRERDLVDWRKRGVAGV